MNREELQKCMDELFVVTSKMLASKGPEYQRGEDVFSNFKTNADDLGLTPYQIWSVYFTKHTKSILNAIKNKPENPNEQDLSESFEGRIIDAVAYLNLLYAMVQKHKGKY
jgi:hypothetical protein